LRERTGTVVGTRFERESRKKGLRRRPLDDANREDREGALN